MKRRAKIRQRAKLKADRKGLEVRDARLDARAVRRDMRDRPPPADRRRNSPGNTRGTRTPGIAAQFHRTRSCVRGRTKHAATVPAPRHQRRLRRRTCGGTRAATSEPAPNRFLRLFQPRCEGSLESISSQERSVPVTMALRCFQWPDLLIAAATIILWLIVERLSRCRN